jgi:hypothetical protein
VPFPIWYRLDDEGLADHEHPLVASEDRSFSKTERSLRASDD